MTKFPKHFSKFLEDYPDLGQAYMSISDAVSAAGPLDRKTSCLVKLGMAVGSAQEGATHSQVRKALEAGATPDELRHAVLLAVTTLGFPSMMRGLAWVEDVLAK
ncbi:MAG: carboxymuconolactone decarboxylase family protein [Armatimonadetes bacterium]|nr:carboxymuconolactone decarboxylase family protein [Armatimonadota bacterium]